MSHQQCNVTFSKVYGELEREDTRNNARTNEDLEKYELRERWDSGEIKQFLSSKADASIEKEGGKEMLEAQYEDSDEDLEVGDDSSEDDSVSSASDEDD